MVNPHAQRWEEIRRKNRDQGLATRLFRVVGPHTVAGKRTGETVELEVTRDQADALIIAGHVVEIPFEPREDFPAEYSDPEFLGWKSEADPSAPVTETTTEADEKPAQKGPSAPRTRRGK